MFTLEYIGIWSIFQDHLSLFLVDFLHGVCTSNTRISMSFPGPPSSGALLLGGFASDLARSGQFSTGFTSF